MTRMIERWFPSAEVSANSGKGWGSGNSEISLFTWFAKRPTAQAKAATVCSLLRWPDDEAEQLELQELVRSAMQGRYAAWTKLTARIAKDNPGGAETLDPFSGRGMVPLESARLGVGAHAIDYSPVAVLASSLLTSAPFADWSGEPELPFGEAGEPLPMMPSERLLHDLEVLFGEVGRRHQESMAEVFPRSGESYPWGYVWATSIECQECSNRFPLIGSYVLNIAKGGESATHYGLEVDRECGTWKVVLREGEPTEDPTLTNSVVGGRKVPGKMAVCPFCAHVHPLAVHRRLLNEGQGKDVLLLSADIDDRKKKTFRVPTSAEYEAAEAASLLLAEEPSFTPFLPATPDEGIAPGNNNVIGPSIYGARTYGDLMVDRQTLSYVRLAKVIAEISEDLRVGGISERYVRVLAGYSTAVVTKKLRSSTRGARFRTSDGARIGDLFVNEASITFSHDFFEAGLGDGPGTWGSVSSNFLSACRNLFTDIRGMPADIQHGTATALPFSNNTFDAVVTDPPYDQMIPYADASDLFYVWIKRCLHNTWPELAVTADRYGAQDKAEEIIVKRVRGEAPDEHRTREHYDRLITQAFSEMKRVVRPDGVVTIVFGHGEPEVWQRLLTAIEQAGLVMTASWPANTEGGGQQGKANIKTTLTMACRPAPPGRQPGRKGAVEAAVRREVAARYEKWRAGDLAPADMLMAAAGPAMEVVGRYSEVLDAKGEPVGIHTFLPLARASILYEMAFEIDHHPLETFDARTRFALWWVKLYGRQIQAKAELRWQALASSLDLEDVRDLVPDKAGQSGGVVFVTAASAKLAVTADSAVIDVALALARVSEEGMDAMGAVLVQAGRTNDDAYLWAAVKSLASMLPSSDADAIAFSRVLRSRDQIGDAADAVIFHGESTKKTQKFDEDQYRLL